MADLTLQAIEHLLENKLEPINIKLGAIEEIVSGHTESFDKQTQTLNSHTNTLDAIAKNTHDWNTELIAVRARLDRHDQWFKQVAEHLNVKLDA